MIIKLNFNQQLLHIQLAACWIKADNFRPQLPPTKLAFIFTADHALQSVTQSHSPDRWENIDRAFLTATRVSYIRPQLRFIMQIHPKTTTDSLLQTAARTSGFLSQRYPFWSHQHFYNNNRTLHSLCMQLTEQLDFMWLLAFTQKSAAAAAGEGNSMTHAAPETHPPKL